MKQHYFLLLSFSFLFLLFSLHAFSQKGTILLYAPYNYQVLSISPNGKWACGAVSDGYSVPYGFVWNLQSDEITTLSTEEKESAAFDISDNGIAVGKYTSTERTENHAPVVVAGYWEAGKWHSLETIAGAYVTDITKGGVANCISRNGRYMGGSLYDAQGKYTPVSWANGKIEQLYQSDEGTVYDISDDGKMACGWTLSPTKGNRTYCFWTPQPQLLKPDEASPWACSRAFSPDGENILCFNFIYHIATGKTTSIPYLDSYPMDFNTYAISNNGIVLGYEIGDNGDTYATIFKEGKVGFLKSYLEENGARFNDEQTTLARGSGVSEDAKVVSALVYINDENGVPQMTSLVAKLGENITSPSPVSLKATQLDGIQTVKLDWKKPLANENSITGYYVYRDGIKISSVSATKQCYFDSSLSQKTYSYAVSAVYSETESEKSLSSNVTVEEKQLTIPQNLFALPSGLNDVRLGWRQPESRMPSVKYFENGDEINGFGGGGRSFEAAVRFEKERMKEYSKNFRISHVVFYPMSKQEKWTINIYKGKKILYSQDVDGNSLEYCRENRICLSNSLVLPDDEDLYVGIKVKAAEYSNNVLGMVFGKKIAGYSDLVRLSTDLDFYSLYEASQKSESGGYDFSITWGIGILMTQEKEKAIDNIDHYNIYCNDRLLEQTNEMNYVKENLSDGNYLFGVEAVYETGQISPKAIAKIELKANEKIYKKISSVKTDIVSDQLTATWAVPANDDEIFISYSGNTPGSSIKVKEEQPVNYWVAAKYNKNKITYYERYKIKGFRFYPTGDATFHVSIYEDNQEVYSQLIDSYTKNQWNTIALHNQLDVNPNAEYMVVLNCEGVSSGVAPICLDNQVPFVNVSDLFGQKEGSFSSVSTELNIHGNWMMGLVIASQHSKSLPVSGYNVRIDGTKKNEALLINPEVTYTFGSKIPDEIHTINVDVIYEEIGEKRGETVSFKINPTSEIDEKEMMAITVYPNPATSYVCVDGEVDSITIYDIDGTQVGYVLGNKADVSGLSTGIYLLKIMSDNAKTVVKVNVMR